MSLRVAPIAHEFIAIDEGLAQLLHIDERNSAQNWVVPINHPQARDLQLIGGGRVLVGHDHGYSEFDIATGELLKDVATYSGVTSVRRQAGGNTLLAGVNLAGEHSADSPAADRQRVVVLELDPAGKPASTTVFPASYLRLLRQTAQGTWLMTNQDVIREADPGGRVLQEWAVPGLRHAWKAVRLPNGRTLASAGYGAFLLELDPDGGVARKFAEKEAMPAALNARFYATFQLLSNGHIVVANWQGHGPGHGASGVQLFELDPSATIVWQWSEPSLISSLQAVLVLDGLDTSKLHDERAGVMAPVEAKREEPTAGSSFPGTSRPVHC
jgi:hypothetical protein